MRVVIGYVPPPHALSTTTGRQAARHLYAAALFGELVMDERGSRTLVKGPKDCGRGRLAASHAPRRATARGTAEYRCAGEERRRALKEVQRPLVEKGIIPQSEDG